MEGTYEFKTASDDASFIILDGEVLVDNGGYHGVEVKSNTYEVENMGCKSVEVLFGEAGGGASMKLEVKTPESSNWATDFSSIFFTQGITVPL